MTLVSRNLGLPHRVVSNQCGVHGVYERSQTCELREIERTGALRVREVISHQQNARVAPMRNRCSKIDGFMVLDSLRTTRNVQRAVKFANGNELKWLLLQRCAWWPIWEMAGLL